MWREDRQGDLLSEGWEKRAAGSTSIVQGPKLEAGRAWIACDGHVAVLAASIRNLEQLLYCFALETDLVTVPSKVLDDWARNSFPILDGTFKYTSTGKPILYQELVLDQPWQSFDIEHGADPQGD